jgi:uncharacterized membrane protein YfcA
MEFALGFVIAVFISLTGVGAGSLTVPLLILLVHLPTAQCVGTAQIFAAVVKLLTVPGYISRKQVNWRVVFYMLATGLPGVLVGALLLKRIPMGLVTGMVGLIITSIALLNLFRFSHVVRHDRTPWMAAIGLPVGLEMGFSAAGSGAIGALALMSLTTLNPAEIVGTGLCFGFVLSVAGSAVHLAIGTVNTAVLWKLLVGGAAGAFAGTSVSAHVPSKKLRLALCVILVAIGAQLFWKSLSEFYSPVDAASPAVDAPALVVPASARPPATK